MKFSYDFFFLINFVFTALAENSANSSVVKIAYRAAWEIPETNFSRLGLFYCRIPKNGSTLMKIVLCDLYRYFKRISFTPKFTRDEEISECQLQNWYEKVKLLKKPRWELRQKRELVKFSVIRHPIDRFVSLYGHFCEQLKYCGETNIEIFARDLYNLMSNGWKNSTANGKIFIHARQLIYYHAQPQFWFCNFPLEIENYHLVHHNFDGETMKSELQMVFDEAAVPRKYSNKVLQHVTNSTTGNAMRDGKRRNDHRKNVESNLETMRYLRAIYHSDFELFEYS
ncbi:unnamed protein product, partial [Mesorhabditis belari]|uniref:Sulfotransferase family protein n=1 Tax=Mesorhabditis belari TaxID=2138241 RepID=A0AAF3F1F4_9BILA